MGEIINKFLFEDQLVLIPMLLILGSIIKMTPNVRDWLIPYILLVNGVVISMIMLGPSAESFIQGVLVAGAAVFGNELFQQAKERD